MIVTVPRLESGTELKVSPQTKGDCDFLSALVTCLRNEDARKLLVPFVILTADSVEKISE